MWARQRDCHCIPTYWSYCFWRALGFFKRGCILERVLPVKISKESVGRSFTTEYIQSEGFVTKRYQVVSLVSIKYGRTIELKYPRDVDDTTCCCQGKSLASTRGGRANKYPREVDDITSGCQERALAPTRCGWTIKMTKFQVCPRFYNECWFFTS